MDRMRESVFAVLGSLEGLSFLDLFSGSGAIALEAASRGAGRVEAVEMDPLKRRVLLKNVSLSPVRIHCRFLPVELYVKRAQKKFDIIFLDPPFPYRYRWDLLRRIASSPLVSNETKILLHRPREDSQKEQTALLDKTDTREYGRSVVDMFISRKKTPLP
jgi:16S rRNA (guanine(966)-N(2))-methyltransferase RsmD